jgi:transcriptional regulator with XRE-family HTH domain
MKVVHAMSAHEHAPMPAKTYGEEADEALRLRASALGHAIRVLREERHMSRAELLDRFYTELEHAGIDYTVKGDWWLSGIENGDKAKQLPHTYLDAFIRALACTPLEAIRLLFLADLNTLTCASHMSYTIGLTYVLREVFPAALKVIEAQIDETTAARLDEREWMEIGRSVLEVVVADMKHSR